MAISVVRIDDKAPMSDWSNRFGEGVSLSMCASQYADGYRMLKEAILDKAEIDASIETGRYMLVTVNDHTFRARVRQTEGLTAIYVHPDDRGTVVIAAAQIHAGNIGQQQGKAISPWKRQYSTDLPLTSVGAHSPGRQKLRDTILGHELTPHSITTGDWMTLRYEDTDVRVRVRGTPMQDVPYVHRDDEQKCQRLIRLMNRDTLEADEKPKPHRLVKQSPDQLAR